MCPCFPSHAVFLGDRCPTPGLRYPCLAGVSLINASSAELGTYNPGACLTSPAACLRVSPDLPYSSNPFEPSSSSVALSSKVSGLKASAGLKGS